MRKLILHLGVHKTATTYFQSRLQNTNDKLLERGVCYLDLGTTRKELTAKISQKTALSHEFKEGMLENEVIFVFDENILGGVGVPQGIYHYPDALARLSYVVENLIFEEVEVHLTIRDPESYLVSRYCEFLRHFSYIPIEEYLSKVDVEVFSWIPLVHLVESIFGNLVVTVFEDIFDDEIGYLRRLTGVDVDFSAAYVNADIRRAKFSNETYEIVKMMATCYPGYFIRRFINVVDRSQECTGTTPIRPFSNSLSLRLKENYRRDQQQLHFME